MIRYTLHRLFLTLPTLIIVLAFSFLLKSLAPGDEVARILELNGVSEQLGKEIYLNSYKETSARFHLDKPQFYFSILPSYFPDTLHRIIPMSKRELLKSLVIQTKDWEKVDRFNKSLRSGQSKNLERDTIFRTIGMELLKFDQDRSLQSIIQRKNKLSQLCKESNCPIEVSNIIYSIEQLELSNRISFPQFRLNGMRCQFHYWISSLFSSKSNISLRDGAPVYNKIWRALKWSLSISIPTFILLALCALTIAKIQVHHHQTIVDRGISGLLYLLYSTPLFWLSTVAVIFFTTDEYGTWTNLFPSIGLRPIFKELTFFEELSRNMKQLILPIICSIIGGVSYIAIQLKSDLLNALNQPYSVMAQAKGLSPNQIINKHALPNALVPYITVLTGAIPNIFAGSVIIEVIFNIPGMGRLLFRSIQELDWPVVFTIILISAIITSLGYLIGDLLLAKLYPKLRTSLISNSSVQNS